MCRSVVKCLRLSHANALGCQVSGNLVSISSKKLQAYVGANFVPTVACDKWCETLQLISKK